MYGGVDEFEALAHLFDRLFRESQLGNLFIIALVHRFRDGLDEAAVRLFDGEIVGDLFDVSDDHVGRFGRHLRAVFAVDLVAVVLLGVVTGGNHDARDGAQPAHSVGEHGDGMHVVKDVGGDAVRREDARRRAREFLRFAAGIVGDDHAPLHGRRAQGFDVFRKTLRCAADGVHVHHVRAVADDAAHARGAEFEFRAEAVFDLLRPVQRRIFAPGTVRRQIIHRVTSDQTEIIVNYI